MNKYLIIDKNTMSRESIASLIYEYDEHSLINESESIQNACKLTEHCQLIDIVIVNPDLDYMNQTDYINDLREVFPDSKFLVFSHQTEREHIESLLENGAHGIVTISSSKSEIISAIQSLKSNQLYVGQSVLKKSDIGMVSNQPNFDFTISHRKKPKQNLLTTRQREVLNCISKGYANKLIAYELGVSEGTVKLHVSSILRALKVKNRTEAALTASQMMNLHAH